jgi:hypothetical protein
VRAAGLAVRSGLAVRRARQLTAPAGRAAPAGPVVMVAGIARAVPALQTGGVRRRGGPAMSPAVRVPQAVPAVPAVRAARAVPAVPAVRVARAVPANQAVRARRRAGPATSPVGRAERAATAVTQAVPAAVHDPVRRAAPRRTPTADVAHERLAALALAALERLVALQALRRDLPLVVRSEGRPTPTTGLAPAPHLTGRTGPVAPGPREPADKAAVTAVLLTEMGAQADRRASQAGPARTNLAPGLPAGRPAAAPPRPGGGMAASATGPRRAGHSAARRRGARTATGTLAVAVSGRVVPVGAIPTHSLVGPAISPTTTALPEADPGGPIRNQH